MTPRSSRYRSLGGLSLCLWLGLVGCGTTEELRPVVLPGLAGLDESARLQFQNQQARLSALANRRVANNDALGEAYGGMGQLLLAYHFYDAAEPALLNAESLLPKDVRWPSYLGYLYQLTVRLEAAARSYERARTLRPEETATYIHLAGVYRDLERDADAKALLHEAIRRDPRSAGAFYLLGQIAEEPSEAITHFEKVLELQPSASVVHNALGLAYRDRGDLERSRYHLARSGNTRVQARDVLLRELEGMRRGPSANMSAASQLLRQGRLREAAIRFEQVVAEDPESIIAYVNLGGVYERLDQSEKASEALERALRLDPSHPIAHYILAMVLRRRGDEAKALAHFQAAVEADPDYSEARFALATIFWRRRQCQEAGPHFDRFVAAYPEHVDARLAQAMCHDQLGEHAEARALVEAGLAMLPENVRLLNGMTRVLAASADDGVRDGPRALEIAEHLVSVLPRVAGTFEILAMAYAEVGRYEDAVEQQKEAIRVAEQQGLNTWLDHLNANLRRYEQRQPCRIPWAAVISE